MAFDLIMSNVTLPSRGFPEWPNKECLQKKLTQFTHQIRIQTIIALLPVCMLRITALSTTTCETSQVETCFLCPRIQMHLIRIGGLGLNHCGSLRRNIASRRRYTDGMGARWTSKIAKSVLLSMCVKIIVDIRDQRKRKNDSVGGWTQLLKTSKNTSTDWHWPTTRTSM